MVLPTGEVLAVGGLGVDKSFSDEDSKLIPELGILKQKPGEALRLCKLPETIDIALLMMDGRIFAGGVDFVIPVR